MLPGLPTVPGRLAADIAASCSCERFWFAAMSPALGTAGVPPNGAFCDPRTLIGLPSGSAQYAAVWTAIVAIHVVLWLTMRFSLVIIRVIKEGGVVLITRLSGLLLSAIAVQLVASGVFGFVDAYPA